MTQDELNAIWDAIMAGKPVEGWGGVPLSDIDVLRRAKPDELWARKKKGLWVELP